MSTLTNVWPPGRALKFAQVLVAPLKGVLFVAKKFVPSATELLVQVIRIEPAEALIVIIRAAAANPKYFMLQSSNFNFRPIMPFNRQLSLRAAQQSRFWHLCSIRSATLVRQGSIWTI